MADGKIELQLVGLEDLRRQLLQVPHDIQREAARIVNAHAEGALNEIRDAYPVRDYGRLKNRGALARGVRMDKAGSATTNWGVLAVVRNRAPHAWLFEHGTATRRWARGKNVGAARPGHIFIPIAMKWKTRMVRDLMALLERTGFGVNRAQAA